MQLCNGKPKLNYKVLRAAIKGPKFQINSKIFILYIIPIIPYLYSLLTEVANLTYRMHNIVWLIPKNTVQSIRLYSIMSLNNSLI